MPDETTSVTPKRVCSNCKSDHTDKAIGQWKLKDGTIRKCTYDAWFRDKKGGWLCLKCHRKLVTNAKWNPINSPKWNARIHAKFGPRRITYKGKRIQIHEERRIGVCNWCRAVKAETDAQRGKLCNRTDMAHFAYHDDDPLKDTLELCATCHMIFDDLGGDIRIKKGKRKQKI